MTRNRRKVVTEMIFVGIILLITLAFFVFSFKRSIKNGLPPRLIPKKKAHPEVCFCLIIFSRYNPPPLLGDSDSAIRI